MIEVPATLRCIGCRSTRAVVLQMSPAWAFANDSGGLVFQPKEELRILDIGDWRVDAGAFRCPRC